MVRLSAALVSSRGDEPAVIDDHTTLTWRAFDERANRCLDGLRRRGHEPGATVALLCGNRHEFLECNSALLHGGYRYPPINWHSSPDEIAYIVNDSGATALFADEHHVDAVRAASAGFERAVDVIVLGDQYEQMLAEADHTEPGDQSLGSVMMYTSGTTGRPKGVRSTRVPLEGSIDLAELIVRGYADLFHIDTTGTTLLTAPLYHGGPYIFGAVMFGAGSPIVLRRRFDPASVLRDIDRFEVANAYFVPTHFVRLLRLPTDARSRFDGSSLRSVWHTGAPCPPHVKRAMIDWWGPVVNETYSASDAGVGTIVTSEQWLRKPGTVGPASPLSEIVIVDDDGRVVPAGTVGTVYVRNRFGGDVSYHNDPDKTAEAHLGPSTVTVGDMGHLDDDGYLFLSDRKIDMIISAGVNIYPAEIEACLITHEAVADVAVFGVPDDDFGEQVKAAVLVTPGHRVDDDLAVDLGDFCRARLAGFKVPRSFDFPTEFPRTDTGKLVKRVLRDPYWSGRDRQI